MYSGQGGIFWRRKCNVGAQLSCIINEDSVSAFVIRISALRLLLVASCWGILHSGHTQQCQCYPNVPCNTSTPHQTPHHSPCPCSPRPVHPGPSLPLVFVCTSGTDEWRLRTVTGRWSHGGVLSPGWAGQRDECSSECRSSQSTGSWRSWSCQGGVGEGGSKREDMYYVKAERR